MAAAVPPLTQAVSAQLAKYPTLDPKAVLAIASQEGLGGGIGDGGTSFGPFQLHQGGAYPSSAPQAPQQAEQWANSPTGIDYALGNILKVAGGLKGVPAITNISERFERPANPQREIQGATAAYGGLPAYTPSPLASVAKPGLTPTAATAPAHVGTSPLILAALKLLMS